jgi:hypothetical protein
MFLFISVIISTGKWKDENQTKSKDQQDARLPISRLLSTLWIIKTSLDKLNKSQMNKFQLPLTFSQRNHMVIVEKCVLCVCRRCIRTNRYGAVSRELQDKLFDCPEPKCPVPKFFELSRKIPFVQKQNFYCHPAEILVVVF